MLKFSDLSIGDYFYWGIQKSNIDGDYDVEFKLKQLTIDDFCFMKENDWTEDDLNEFVKPVEITHDIMHKIGFSMEETWAGIIQYSYSRKIKDGIEYNNYKGMTFDLKECVHVIMNENKDEVRKIETDCFNHAGSFHVERVKPTYTHYIHELQHIMRECGIEREINL